MTEENYKYRTSDLFLRNQFNGVGKFDIPEIPKSNFSDDTLENLLLIGFDKINTDQSNYERMVHFFLYDYKFENIWKKPDEYVEKLKKYKAILSPDFSMYIEMNKTLQGQFKILIITALLKRVQIRDLIIPENMA